MRLRKVCLLFGLFASASIQNTQADGTEILNTPSITVANGTGVAIGGVGMVSQPGTLTVEVPAGAIVKQVILYWEGFMKSATPGPNFLFAKRAESPVTYVINGTLIGGPTLFFSDNISGAYASTFRADITRSGLITAGVNQLTLFGLRYDKVNNGAGILVIYDDGTSTRQIELRDGSDLAFEGFTGLLKNTVPQTFFFAPSTMDRASYLDMFFASVAGSESNEGIHRPTAIEVTIGGITSVFHNLLDSNSGDEWDAVRIDVAIPAGASSLTVQPFSRDDLGTGQRPASFDWLAASFVLEPLLAEISGTVFCDLNKNSSQDGGEPGLQNVRVNLLRNNNLISFVSTDIAGQYRFPGLQPGSYQVVVDSSTAPPDCSDPQCPPSRTVALSPGQSASGIDFCFTPPPLLGEIRGTVFCDLNKNSIQDPGDAGLPNVQVFLFLGTTLIGSATTDSAGRYLFTGLQPGSYTAVVDPGTAPPDCRDPQCPPSRAVALNQGQSASGVDFCFTKEPPLLEIRGTVFCDLNKNSIQDPGDAGLPNVQVFLFLGNALIGSATTDSAGRYLFTGLQPGSYTAVVDPGTAPPDCRDPQCPPSRTVPLIAQSASGVDFCFTKEPPLLEIRGTVFCDLNKNSIQDPGEPGLPNVRVNLFKDFRFTGFLLTDSAGQYRFTGLQPGSYLLSVDRNTAPQDCRDPQCSAFRSVFLNPGQSASMIDFCFTRQPPLAEIRGTVFCDLNKNFAQNAGEPGLPNVRVNLFRDNIFIGFASTDSAGRYQFTGLQPGSYLVAVDETSAPPECNVPQCIPSRPVDLNPGQTVSMIDFCFVPPPQPRPEEGCSAKYWEDHEDQWVGYSPNTVISTVFEKATRRTCSAYKDIENKKFDDAIGYGTNTGKLRDAARNLLREAVAALLNARALQGNYPATEHEIILAVNQVLDTCNDNALIELANLLQTANNAGSPLCRPDCSDGKPNRLTFTYTGGSCAAEMNSQSSSKSDCSERNGGLTGASLVQIIVSSSSSVPTGSSQKFFNDMVPLNGAFNVVSAPSSKFESNTYVFIYEGGVLKQIIKVHTSCSAPLIRQETFGGLQLDDFAIAP